MLPSTSAFRPVTLDTGPEPGLPSAEPRLGRTGGPPPVTLNGLRVLQHALFLPPRLPRHPAPSSRPGNHRHSSGGSTLECATTAPSCSGGGLEAPTEPSALRHTLSLEHLRECFSSLSLGYCKRFDPKGQRKCSAHNRCLKRFSEFVDSAI